MSKRVTVAARRVLEILNSRQGKELMEAIGHLADELENKVDPERTEMYLFSNIHSIQEKLANVNFNLNSYVRESDPLLGDKLSSLYGEDDTIRVED